MLIFDFLLGLFEFVEFLASPLGLSTSLWGSAYWILLQLWHVSVPSALWLPLIPAFYLYIYLDRLACR
ncbi:MULTISPECIES: hypothetical protein [unclassified Leptolyngbya]|uniref:hypothetical protein n=1 Tax=unclassified Leptolyngbya TaxID=2650499 RepID=UPI0016843FCB|nr:MULTISPECIES: hypothetical protein [unclassified Leptolyngbya]MBD1912325.1 hypothetical protein [Leptolyngbya sp. FACHB-8]MBD2158039.1 hypothetical protein [Leptolyngbya sp. FACHB-16]